MDQPCVSIAGTNWRIDMRWMSNPSDRAHRSPPTNDAFHAWVLSLPWVVERSAMYETLGVRTFAIACEPLDIRQLWLVTGMMDTCRIGVVVPDVIAEHYEAEGVGRFITPMPADHSLFGVFDDTAEDDVERVVLDAYGSALS
jgi:hypothetical protein